MTATPRPRPRPRGRRSPPTDKLAHRRHGHRRERPAGAHRHLPDRLGPERPPGPAHRGRRGGAAADLRVKPVRREGAARGPLGAARLRRHRRPRPARRGARRSTPSSGSGRTARAIDLREWHDRPDRTTGSRTADRHERHADRLGVRSGTARRRRTPPASGRGSSTRRCRTSGGSRRAPRRRILATYRPSDLVSSDLARAGDTARTLAEVVHLPVRYDERLREIHVGRWQGRTTAEAESEYPEEHAALARGEDIPRGVDGETMAQVAARASGAGPGHHRAARGADAVVAHPRRLRARRCRLPGRDGAGTGVERAGRSGQLPLGGRGRGLAGFGRTGDGALAARRVEPPPPDPASTPRFVL